MNKINPIKYISTKIARIKEDTLPGRPATLEEATINLLNFFVKSKRAVSLQGKAHQIDVKAPKIQKITNLFKPPKKK